MGFRHFVAGAEPGGRAAGAGGAGASKLTLGAVCDCSVAANRIIGLELAYIVLAKNTCGKVRSVVLKSRTASL